MSVFKKLEDNIADLAELQVQTFTGTLTASVAGTDASLLDWTKVMDSARTSGQVKLAASARIKFDGDTDLFFDQALTQDLMDAHLKAIESAQKIREGLIQIAGDVLNLR